MQERVASRDRRGHVRALLPHRPDRGSFADYSDPIRINADNTVRSFNVSDALIACSPPTRAVRAKRRPVTLCTLIELHHLRSPRVAFRARGSPQLGQLSSCVRPASLCLSHQRISRAALPTRDRARHVQRIRGSAALRGHAGGSSAYAAVHPSGGGLGCVAADRANDRSRRSEAMLDELPSYRAHRHVHASLAESDRPAYATDHAADSEGQSSITSFEISADGSLRPVGKSPSGGAGAVSSAVSPDGRHFVCAN